MSEWLASTRRTALALSLLTALALAGGCAREAGRDFRSDRIDDLSPAITTIDQAVALLGQPIHVTRSPRGFTVVTWYHFRDRPAGTESAKSVILFGRDGRMEQVVDQRDTRDEGASSG